MRSASGHGQLARSLGGRGALGPAPRPCGASSPSRRGAEVCGGDCALRLLIWAMAPPGLALLASAAEAAWVMRGPVAVAGSALALEEDCAVVADFTWRVQACGHRWCPSWRSESVLGIACGSAPGISIGGGLRPKVTKEGIPAVRSEMAARGPDLGGLWCRAPARDPRNRPRETRRQWHHCPSTT